MFEPGRNISPEAYNVTMGLLDLLVSALSQMSENRLRTAVYHIASGADSDSIGMKQTMRSVQQLLNFPRN